VERERAAKNALLLLMDSAVALGHARKRNTTGWRAPRLRCPDHSQISSVGILFKSKVDNGRLIHPCGESCCSLRLEGVRNEKDFIDYRVVVNCCKSGDRNYVCGHVSGTKRRKGLRFSVFKVAERGILL